MGIDLQLKRSSHLEAAGVCADSHLGNLAISEPKRKLRLPFLHHGFRHTLQASSHIPSPLTSSSHCRPICFLLPSLKASSRIVAAMYSARSLSRVCSLVSETSLASQSLIAKAQWRSFAKSTRLWTLGNGLLYVQALHSIRLILTGSGNRLRELDLYATVLRLLPTQLAHNLCRRCGLGPTLPWAMTLWIRRLK